MDTPKTTTKPWTFEEFVLAQNITDEQRAAWTHDEQVRAYSSYVSMFYSQPGAIQH